MTRHIYRRAPQYCACCEYVLQENEDSICTWCKEGLGETEPEQEPEEESD